MLFTEKKLALEKLHMLHEKMSTSQHYQIVICYITT